MGTLKMIPQEDTLMFILCVVKNYRKLKPNQDNLLIVIPKGRALTILFVFKNLFTEERLPCDAKIAGQVLVQTPA